MKKICKNVITIALSVLMLLSCVACTPQVLEETDESKSQLHVFSITGGIGRKWIDAAAERFVEDYEDYEFEPGTNKKGVQIKVEAVKKNEHLIIESSKNHVLFTEFADYALMVSDQSIIEISDIIDKPLNEIVKTDDTKSIRSKLYQETEDFFSFKDGKFYGLPHHAFFSVISYNKKLFDDKKLYFAKDPTGTDLNSQFIWTSNQPKSCGPDGVYGNEDDGLPATWDEMFMLYDFMKQVKSVTPFIWPGKSNAEHVNYLLNAIYLNLAGKDQARLNYTYDSGDKSITIVEKFDDNGNPVTKEEKVTKDNYRKVLNSQLAKYQTLAIFDKIIDNKDYQHATCNDSTAQMLDAQNDYINSYLEGEPVAMLPEGSYWYNEANDAGYVDNAKLNYPEDYENKNEFKIMPLPRVYSGRASDIANTQVGNTVIGDMPDSLACINASIKDDANLVNLAKMFIAYCYTDESLQEFTELANITIPVKYEVDESRLSDFAKDVWNHTKSSDMILPYSSNGIYLNGKLDWSLNVASSFWKIKTRTAFWELNGASKNVNDFFKSYMAK